MHRFAFTLVMAAASVACGEGGGEEGSGASSSGGGDTTGGTSSGASSGTGASGTGAASAGGGSESGGASGGSDGSDSLCSPGDFVMGAFLFPDIMTNCVDWDPPDVGVDEFLGARSIALPTPMTAGEPYALSFGYLSAGDGTLEYYATDSECGPILEKLSSEDMANRDTICTDTTPSGNYTHLVMLWRETSASLDDATFCPNVTCGE